MDGCMNGWVKVFTEWIDEWRTGGDGSGKMRWMVMEELVDGWEVLPVDGWMDERMDVGTKRGQVKK